VWDGRSDSGEESAPGIYFYRLQAGQSGQTGRIVRLR
jgi:hypothetical protein